MYSYDMFSIKVFYRENLQEDIESNYNVWLEFARQQEYEKLAEEIREKRNKLLEETDKEMCLDRLDLHLPENLTTASLLSGVKQFFESLKNVSNGEMAQYRQALRDITKQEGFPYNVIFPEKPVEKEEN